MKSFISILLLVALFSSCQNSDESALNSDLTGNEVTYNLQQGSLYAVYGNITIKEKKDGSAVLELSLNGTEGELYHPAHLHLGNIAEDNADLAALLNPVYGKTGKSKTPLSMLADETPITYNDLKDLNGCIKIHLSDSGPERDIILAGGNIGAASNSLSGGRIKIAICKSE
jgi:hypothetical protein